LFIDNFSFNTDCTPSTCVANSQKYFGCKRKQSNEFNKRNKKATKAHLQIQYKIECFHHIILVFITDVSELAFKTATCGKTTERFSWLDFHKTKTELINLVLCTPLNQ